MWNKDFILLVQGQGVSCLGSTLYSVVASLWVYELTGSTVIMSTVYAAFAAFGGFYFCSG